MKELFCFEDAATTLPYPRESAAHDHGENRSDGNLQTEPTARVRTPKAVVSPADRENEPLYYRAPPYGISSGLYFRLSLFDISRITLHGTPAAKLFSGMLCVTTLPAPITQLSPTVTPGQTVTPAPNQQLFPILTGFA